MSKKVNMRTFEKAMANVEVEIWRISNKELVYIQERIG